MFFDISLDGGAGAPQSVEAQQLVADELEVGRALEGQELVEEGDNLRGPMPVLAAAARLQNKGEAVFEPGERSW